ncbi:MAG: sigma-70 family RNA polymerase sigma factor [Planctomycetes bacterium]|nr:sigma-70 family RNA polymerase sigma factor [Planctomycetota bacterium]
MGRSPKETETGPPGGKGFQPTLWSVVLRAKDPASPERRDALERLLQIYWKPAYFFLRGRGLDVEAAKDIAQGFFTAFLERDALRHVERGRGKFRTFLLTSLENYLADEKDRARAQKRGGGRPPLSLDFADAEREFSREPEARESPDRLFRRKWALRVIGNAFDALRRGFEEAGRIAEFEALRRHLSATATEAPSYADVAKQLGVSETEVKVRIHRARRRYREAILAEIRSYTETEGDAQEELRDLFSAFSV